MNRCFDILEQRGFVHQYTDEKLKELLNSDSLSAYVGFDPSADSLHLGHLVPAMLLAHLQRHGHRPIMVIGGGTGMIGDPSGRSRERELLTLEQIEHNSRCIKAQLEKYVSFSGKNAAVMVNNYDWLSKFSMLNWLRDVGKYFTINYMLAKDSVRMRLEDREQGISYTEFTYMLLQSYDFYHLREHYDCRLQCGGSDQWGNITAGIEFIRKVTGKDAYGLTLPLITTTSGEKFGKSEGNAVFLDPARTSPWSYYQYWVRANDADAVHYLNLFTFLPAAEIAGLAEEIRQHPEKREAQKRLAREATALVHGAEKTAKLERAAEILYNERVTEIDTETLAMVFQDAPVAEIGRSSLEKGMPLADFMAENKITASKGEAKKLLASGAVYINNLRAAADGRLESASQLKKNLILFRKGKKDYWLIRVR